MAATDNSPAGEANGGIPAADAQFLIHCLQNTTGGAITVDYAKVAPLVGFTNIKSVSNKVTALKKKYNLPLGGGSASVTPKGTPVKSKKASDDHGPNEPAVPKTPSKNRVTKAKKTPTPRAKIAKPNKESEDEMDIEDEAHSGESLDKESREDADQEDEDGSFA